MNKIFRHTVFYRLITTAMYSVVIYCLTQSMLSDSYFKNGAGLGILMFTIISLIVLFSIYSILEVWIEKIIIQHNRIIYKNVFRKKEILNSNVRGFEVNGTNTFIQSNDDSVGLGFASNLKNEIKITDYLNSKFSEIYVDENDVSLYDDQRFGKTKQEREVLINKGFKIARILNWLGILISILFCFFPIKVVAIFLLIIPLTAIYVAYKSNDLIYPISDKNIENPTVFSSWTFPFGAMMLYSFYLSNWEGLYEIIWYSFLFTILIYVYFHFKTKSEHKSGFFTHLVLVLSLFGIITVVFDFINKMIIT